MSKIIATIFILLITTITATGDYFLKKSGQNTNTLFNKHLITGTLIYTFTSIMWAFTYKYMKFSTSVTIYSIFSIIIFAFIGVFIFKDTISIIEIIGIIFAILSLVILVRFG